MSLPRTTEALADYDARAGDRLKLSEEIQTDRDVDAWRAACADALRRVQDAFYEDCVANGIPNSRDHCRLVDVATLRRWAKGI